MKVSQIEKKRLHDEVAARARETAREFRGAGRLVREAVVRQLLQHLTARFELAEAHLVLGGGAQLSPRWLELALAQPVLERRERQPCT